MASSTVLWSCRRLRRQEEEEDHRIRELRVALLSNLALASSRQKKFRPAVNFCEADVYGVLGDVYMCLCVGGGEGEGT